MQTTRFTAFAARTALAFLILAGCEPDAGAPAPEPHAQSAPVLRAASTVTDALTPTTAVDPETGAAYLAFFRKDGDQTNVYLARREPGASAWSEAVRVNSVPGDASPHAQAPAQVAVGPEGHVYVAWTNAIPIEGRRFPASNLLFARSTDEGRTFNEQRAVNSDADARTSSHTFHDITVGRDGVVYVSWLDSRKRDAATAAAETPVRPAGMGEHSHHAGSSELPGTELWVASSRDGGDSFSAGTVVAGGTCQCCRTSMAVANDGSVHIVWRHIFGENERDMAIAHSTDGGATFSAPSRIHADHWEIDGCPHAGPSLVIDAQGQYHVGWYTGEPTRAGIYYARSENGTTFSEPQALVTGVGVSQVKLSGNGLPTVLVAWEDKHSQSVRLGYATPSGVESLEAGFEAATLPAISASPNGWIAVAQEGSDVAIVSGE
ncbi:MAG: sialidase family protein [Rhodothermales bacterium]